MAQLKNNSILNNLTLSKENGNLRDELDTWDKNDLIDYAILITQALAEEQEAVENMTSQYTSAQNWALGMALIEEIGRSLASTLDLNEVLRRLLSRSYSAINVEDGSIMLVEEPSGDLVSQIILGDLSKGDQPFRVPKGQGIAGEVVDTGIPVIVNDVHKDKRHFKKIDDTTGFVTNSILCVPILTHEKVLGVLEVVNKRSGPFTQQDQILLSSIANYAGIAIENAQLHQKVVEERNHVIHAQVEVSHKLQRDLHDGPTQLVAAVQMSIDFCQQALKHDAIPMAIDELQNMMDLAKRTSHQMRTLLFELRPLILETKGLVPALQFYLERRQEEEDEIKLHFVCNSDQVDNKVSRMEPDIEAALFAIIQESVNNAVKHAQADNIFVRLTEEHDHLTLSITDDGEGFDVHKVIKDYEERGSYGMVNLRERVAIAQAQYSINSAPGEGTEILIYDVPLDKVKAKE